MKSTNINLHFSVSELLNSFEQLRTEELKQLSDKLNKLLYNRNNPTPEEREQLLLQKIQKQLPPAFLIRFEALKLKMEAATLSKSEFVELRAYTETIETFDFEKIEALQELAQLRQTSFQQLSDELQVFQKQGE